MAKTTISVEVQKETYEVGVLVAEVVSAIKAKKPLAQIALEELDSLKKAVDGLSEIPAEAKADLESFGLAVGIPLVKALAAAVKSSDPAPAEAPSA